MIREIPSQFVETFWPMAEPYFAKALEFHPHLGTAGLKDILVNGLADMFVVLDGPRIIGAAAIEAWAYPNKTVGNVIALGMERGSFKVHGKELISAGEQWCKARKLGSLHTLGRAGWSRILKRHGWQVQPSIVAWKELA